ncbi:MAG TPA: hypothetical protein VIF57_28085 [Polyangia bacterium]
MICLLRGDAVIRCRARVLALAVLLLAIPFAAGCASPACGQLAFFEIYLDGGRSALDGGVLTLCVNGACNAGKPVWTPPSNRWEGGQFALTGELSTTATFASFFLRPDGRAEINANVPLQQESGDLFDIRFVDAQGAVALDFSRNVLYHTERGCLVGATRVWPSSPSGLTCSARTCESGATVTADVMLPDGSPDGAGVEICRYDVCDSFTKVCRDEFCGPNWSAPGFMGGLDASMEDYPLDGNRWRFPAIVDDDPAVLSDGDRYRLTITDRNGNILASVDETVVYQQSYPNGTECDPYPCRWASITP